jgi:hypothetical protein
MFMLQPSDTPWPDGTEPATNHAEVPASPTVPAIAGDPITRFFHSLPLASIRRFDDPCGKEIRCVRG